MAATVTRLAGQDARPREAVTAYLATLAGAEQAGTKRIYGSVLRRFAAAFDGQPGVGAITAAALAEWFTGQWEDRAPSTWNVALDAIRSAAAYWLAQGWTAEDPSRLLRRRQVREDRTRALSRNRVRELLTGDDIALREKLLWTMAYQTAARSGELLALDVEDLDLANHCAKVRRKGAVVDVVVWQTSTARLLPRYLKGRTSGPLFVTERRSRLPLPSCDLDPSGRARLSYERAEQMFKAASGGATLHQLRHSALSHDAEDGTSTPMLMARSGHTSVRSLAKYARVSAEALQAHQERRDPARRGR